MNQIISPEIRSIYFIRERDLVTGHVNPYVSIGLDTDNVLSMSRRDHLGPGNPRQLFVDHVVGTTSATAIATVLRFEFMDQAIRPNWYYFGEDSSRTIGDLYERCTQLVADFSIHTSIMNEASEFAKVASGPETADGTSESFGLLKSYLLHDHVVQLCTVVKPLQPESSEPTTKKDEVSRTLDRLLRQMNDQKMEETFKRRYPELYKTFIKTVINASQFAVYGERLEESILKDPLVLQTRDFIRAFHRTFADCDITGDSADGLLMAQYRLDQLSKFCEIQREIARIQLQVQCGTARGIKFICSWERTAREVVDLDALKAAHPDLWEECDDRTWRWFAQPHRGASTSHVLDEHATERLKVDLHYDRPVTSQP